MKKTKSFLFAMIVTLSLVLVGCSKDDALKLKAGTYTAESTGMHAMTVETTVSETEILDIKIEHEETPGIGVPVVEAMPQEILDTQGLGVDIVSGATLTSNGIIEGVIDGLKQAGATQKQIDTLLKKSKEVVKEDDKEVSADVVVVGAGGAGMAAAVTAAEAGKSVVVIEKTSSMGGNTILSGGALNAVDDGSQTALDNKDSVELHYNQTLDGGDKAGDPELVKIMTDQAWSGVEWLKKLGMKFNEGTFTVTGGMWPRAHKPSEPEGTGFFKTYQEYMDKHDNITMLYNTSADELIVEDGVVTGVKSTGKTGNAITVKAENGVVLATGGFGQNIELREKYNEVSKKWPKLDDSIPSTNTSSITGDGLIMAEKVGAELTQMEHIQLLPLGDPKTGSLSGNIEHGVESRIFINKEGNRFVNEGGRRDEMTLALFDQPDSTMYILMDSDGYKTGDEVNNFNESINSLVAAGRAYKGDTLEDLAKQIGVPAENLVKTVEDFNKYVTGGELDGETDSFGRTLFKDKDGLYNGINDGPFYAAERVPTVHHTMGGLKINTDTEVLNTNGEVIKGLFAAGEVVGGIHGTNRLGGNALTDTVVFGRLAGEKAANFTK